MRLAACRHRCRPLGELAQFGLGLGDLAVLQFGGALEIAFARLLFGFEAQLFEAGLQFRNSSDRAALLLPSGAQTLGLLAPRRSPSATASRRSFRGRIFLPLQRGLLDLEVSGLTFQVVDLGRHRADLDGQRGSGFIDQVDRLVGQEAVGDVAVRERGRGNDGGVLDAHLVVRLVALAQPAQDVDGVLDVGLADVDDLEAAFERGILLDILAVLVQRGCADGTQASAGERGLQHVAGVHRALGRARANQRMQLVDEEDDLAVGVFDLLEQRLEAVFKLAAKLGAGDHAAEVERDDALVLEDFRHVAVDDAARESFDDGGFADAGFADEDRIILGPAREHLHHAANLLVAADDRVELALARQVGQVFAVFFERLELALGVLVGDALDAAHGGEGLQHASWVAPMRGERVAHRVALGLGEREQQMLGGNVIVLEVFGLFGGASRTLVRAFDMPGWVPPETLGSLPIAALTRRAAPGPARRRLRAPAGRRLRGLRAARRGDASAGLRGCRSRLPVEAAAWTASCDFTVNLSHLNAITVYQPISRLQLKSYLSIRCSDFGEDSA